MPRAELQWNHSADMERRGGLAAHYMQPERIANDDLDLATSCVQKTQFFVHALNVMRKSLPHIWDIQHTLSRIVPLSRYRQGNH